MKRGRSLARDIELLNESSDVSPFVGFSRLFNISNEKWNEIEDETANRACLVIDEPASFFFIIFILRLDKNYTPPTTTLFAICPGLLFHCSIDNERITFFSHTKQKHFSKFLL